MQITAQPAFNQSGVALYITARKITFARKMNIAAGANASAEAAGNFVIAQINVCAAGRTDCRCRRAQTSCLRLHSKHSTTEFVWRFQKSSSLPKRDEEGSGAGASSVVRSFRTGFGTNGVKARPHWRHIELFAAAYSICLKPQCGHSALTFVGDGLGTVCLAKLSFTLALRMPP